MDLQVLGDFFIQTNSSFEHWVSLSSYDHMLETFSYLLEARELVEEHAEHHLVGLGGQVGQEEDLVGRGVVHAALALSARDSSTNRRCTSL